jgi:hypothetical protein
LLARLRAAFPDEHAKLVAAPPAPAASQRPVNR